MGKVIIDCMDFPHPWSLASLNMETKILILNTLCFSIICLYTGTLSPRDKLHKIAPLPLLNTKIILSIINTKLFIVNFFDFAVFFYTTIAYIPFSLEAFQSLVHIHSDEEISNKIIHNFWPLSHRSFCLAIFLRLNIQNHSIN